MKRKSVLITVLLLTVASITQLTTVARAAVIVTPTALQGWVIFPFGTTPSYQFVNGPSTPPLGIGSFYTSISASNSKILLGRQNLHLSPLSALSIQYSTYRTGTNPNDWYLNVYVDTTGIALSHNCRLDFAPSAGSVGTWITHNAMTASSGWYGSGAGCSFVNVSWSTIQSTLPTSSRIINPFTGNTYPGVILNMGDTASSYVGYSGNLDNVTINGTTWDFELDAPANTSSFFNPGDCRYDPQPGDRLAICCETSRIVAYGVRPDGVGFLLSTFDFEDLESAGKKGIYRDRKPDGVISAAMDVYDNNAYIWAAWNGGQYQATGQPQQGFAKLVVCPLAK